MKLTTNLGLKKPDGTDVVNIEDLNYNADKIDAEVQSLKKTKANASHKHSMGDISGLSLAASNISIADTANVITATNVEGALKEIVDKANTNKTNLNNLTITVTNNKKTVDTNIGNLSELKTLAKNNLVSSINELFQNVSNGKSSIATAITGKGVAASCNDTFSTLATKIGQISTTAKWASGKISVTGTTSVTINNLSFKPDLVLMAYDSRLSIIINDFPNVGTFFNFNNSNVLCYNNTIGMEFFALSGVYAGVYDNGFKIYMSTGYTGPKECTWIAYKLK